MKTQLPKQIFVTGTGTDVGKTVISAILVAGLNAKYWKPVQCGLDNPTDSQWIQQKTAVPESFIFKEAYALQQPLSPHAAAELEDTEILMSNFTLPDVHHDEHLIVEGAGGIMVPLNKDKLVLDLIIQLKIPVLLVSSNILGTINHTLLSLEKLRQAGVEILGVILNGEHNEINKKAIEQYGNTVVLAEVPHIDEITADSLKQQFHQYFLH